MPKQDTTKDTQIEIIKSADYEQTIDHYLTMVSLDRTMGDVCKSREHATTAREYSINSMIFNAVFEADVELIKTLSLRIDGTVPEEGKRSGYANILGDAIEDVLDYDSATQLRILPTDKPIIAMAKILVFVASEAAGNNMTRRRERNLAASMILERTGGRKVQPTKPMIETKYVEPDWMIGDGDGQA